MKKKLACLIILIIGINICSFSLANSVNDFNPGDVEINTNVQSSSLINITNNILAVLTAFGSILSVIMIIVIGINLMMGSPQEKEKYIEKFKPYLIGAVLVFSASLIANIVFNIVTKIQI